MPNTEWRNALNGHRMKPVGGDLIAQAFKEEEAEVLREEEALREAELAQIEQELLEIEREKEQEKERKKLYKPRIGEPFGLSNVIQERKLDQDDQVAILGLQPVDKPTT